MRNIFLALFALVFSTLVAPSAKATQASKYPAPSFSSEFTSALLEVWSAPTAEQIAKAEALVPTLGFDDANLIRISVNTDAEESDIHRLTDIANAVFGNEDVLGIDSKADGILWPMVPRNVALKAPSLDIPGNMTQINWAVQAGKGDFNHNRRMAVYGLRIVLPLVRDGTIKIVGSDPEFFFDESQWKTRTGFKLREDRERVWTGTDYDIFHFLTFGGTTTRFKKKEGVKVGELIFMKRTEESEALQKASTAVMYLCLTEIIIPAGHAGPDGKFVAPTDDEFVAYAIGKFGPTFASAIASAATTSASTGASAPASTSTPIDVAIFEDPDATVADPAATTPAADPATTTAASTDTSKADTEEKSPLNALLVGVLCLLGLIVAIWALPKIKRHRA